MVADATTNPDGEPPARLIPWEHRTDPMAYVRARSEILERINRGEISSADYKRMADAIEMECQANTGVSYEDAAREGQDAIKRFMGLMQTSEIELKQVCDAIARIDDVRVTEGLKKKWVDLCRRTVQLQAECRADPAKFAVYADRDDDPERAGEVLEMAGCHLRMYEVWNDPDFLNSLVEAPIGHGKSKNLRIQAAWEIGGRPELRCLYVTDEKGKARQSLMCVRGMLKSPRYRAIFPEVRVLGRWEDAEDSSLHFTVARKNQLAKDATFHAAGIDSRVQGNRYDRIYADDICPPDVEQHQYLRQRVNQKWTVIEARRADAIYSRIRMTCTPWSPDDVAGQIQRDVANGKIKGWRVEIDAFIIRRDSEGHPIPIWSKWGREYLENERMRNPSAYAHHYELKFVERERKVVQKLHYYNADPGTTWPPDARLQQQIIEFGERWLSIDPAGTEGYQSSDTGAVEFVLSPNGYCFLTDCWFWHCSISDVIDKVVELICTAPGAGYRGVHWEAAGAVKVGLPAVIELVKIKLAERGYQNALNWIMTSSSVGQSHNRQNRGKTSRLRDCAGYFDNALVRLAGRARTMFDRNRKPITRFYEPAPNSTIAKLSDHLLNFDASRNTDAVDAATQWILHNAHRIKNPYPHLLKADEPQALAPPETPRGLLGAELKRLTQGSKQQSMDDESQFMAAMSGQREGEAA